MTRMDRRSLLLTSAGVGIAPVLLPVWPAAAAEWGPDRADGLPMPAPLDGPSPGLPQPDPSRTLLAQGWRFHEGDVPFPAPADHNATYLSVKAGNATGPAAFAFDDSDWASVTLPHDWAIAQDVSPDANVSQGYRPRGIGWYRRLLRLDAAEQGRRLELHFGAIATHATIWVNGSEVAHSWSGYSGIIVDLTPFARYGDELNWIAIRVDATKQEGWWYEGAGMYRHAWLVSRPTAHIATDGVHCDPVQAPDGSWQVPVTVTLGNVGEDSATRTVAARLVDADGRVLARGTADATVAPLEQAAASMSLATGAVRTWSPDDPVLYDVEIDLLDGGAVVETRRIAIGFRTIRFDPDLGMFVNGVGTKLKGVCLHQDHAGTGVAVPDSLALWRLQRLKAMGCNAIRMSHNAVASELLDWCDRLGFLVMAENRLFNPAPDYREQLEWMVRRDRNHPCIFAWSIFNEEPMQGTHAGVEMMRRMRATVRELDTQRPITGAMNGSFYNPENVSSELDLMGFNYYQADYDKFHALNPDKPITSSEDTSAYETRGAFVTDPSRNVITSFDKEAASWGATHRESWREIMERPFVAGGFVWTGFDYHGEPTPHAWPTISSFFGILDLCGFPKTAFGIHSAHWRDDAPNVWLAPHWTWSGQEGQPIEVFVISNAPALELRLNGEVIERVARADRIMGHTFTVPYQPGRLEALALDGSRVVARAMHETVGVPVALRLTPARTAIATDGEDMQPVTVDCVDARGRHVPVANLPVEFAIEGGRIAGLGNGDPNSHESGQGTSRSLFNGLAQVIVEGDRSDRRLRLRASANGLRAATLVLPRAKREPRPQVPVEQPRQLLAQWRRSAAMQAKPAGTLAPVDGDNNSWDFVQPGSSALVQDGGWRGWHTRFTPWRAVAASGGTLAFAAIAGAAEVWIDGQLAGRKDSAGTDAFSVPVPSGAAARSLTVLIRGDAGDRAGLAGPVAVIPVD